VKGGNGQLCKNKARRGVYCTHHACPVAGCTEAKSSQAQHCATHERNKAPGALATTGAGARAGTSMCAYIKGGNGQQCKNKARCGMYCTHHACPATGCTEAKSSQAQHCTAHSGLQGEALRFAALPVALALFLPFFGAR